MKAVGENTLHSCMELSVVGNVQTMEILAVGKNVMHSTWKYKLLLLLGFFPTSLTVFAALLSPLPLIYEHMRTSTTSVYIQNGPIFHVPYVLYTYHGKRSASCYSHEKRQQ